MSVRLLFGVLDHLSDWFDWFLWLYHSQSENVILNGALAVILFTILRLWDSLFPMSMSSTANL